jgi:hypothetical protein
MVDVFQMISPVPASRATTLPRKLQQGYPGITEKNSSPDETPIYTAIAVDHGRRGDLSRRVRVYLRLPF